MTTESVDIIIGAKDNASAVMKRLQTESRNAEKRVGDIADTSARTTAAMAIMLQTMQGSQLAQFVGDLALVKASLDGVRAATASNASMFEKLIAKASLFVSAFSIGFKVGSFFSSAKKDAEDLNKELERAKRLTAELSDSGNRRKSQRRFEIGLIDDPDKKKAVLRKYADEIKTTMAGSEDAVKRLQKTVDEQNTTLNNWTGRNKALRKLDSAALEEARVKAKEYKKEWLDMEQQIQQFDQAERKRIAKERDDFYKQRTQQNKEYVKSLEEEVKTLGMTNDQLAIYKLRQNGAFQADLDRTEALLAQRTEKQRLIDQGKEAEMLAKQLQQASKSYVEALKLELMALNEGADAAARYRLELSGVSSAAIAEGKQYQNQIDALKERNRLQAEGKALMQANLTPLEKYEQEYTKLARLFKMRLVDEGTYRRQQDKLKAQLIAGSRDISKTPVRADLANEESRFLVRARGGVDPALETANHLKQSNALLEDAKVIWSQINQQMSKLVFNTNQPDEVLN